MLIGLVFVSLRDSIHIKARNYSFTTVFSVEEKMLGNVDATYQLPGQLVRDVNVHTHKTSYKAYHPQTPWSLNSGFSIDTVAPKFVDADQDKILYGHPTRGLWQTFASAPFDEEIYGRTVRKFTFSSRVLCGELAVSRDMDCQLAHADTSIYIDVDTGMLLTFDVVETFEAITNDDGIAEVSITHTPTRGSVMHQVDTARTASFLLYLYLILALFFMAGVPIFLLLLTLQHPHMTVIRWIYGGSISVTSLIALLLVYASTAYTYPPVQIAIASWIFPPSFEQTITSFKERMSLYGYEEGVSVQFDFLNANGNHADFIENVTTIQASGVDLIVSLSTIGTKLITESIKDIPVVFSFVSYPVESGIIKSYISSGTNSVGSRNWISMERQLDTLLRIDPTVERIGFARSRNEQSSLLQLHEMLQYETLYGVTVVPIEADDAASLASALQNTEVDAYFASCDTLISSERHQVIETALRRKKPSFGCGSQWVEEGLLFSLSADVDELGTYMAERAKWILEGFDPQFMHTTSPVLPEVAVNRTTAALIGVPISQEIGLYVDQYFD